MVQQGLVCWLKAEGKPVRHRAEIGRVLVSNLCAVVVTELSDHLEDGMVDVTILQIRADLDALCRSDLRPQLKSQVLQTVVSAPAPGDVHRVRGAGIALKGVSTQRAGQLLVYVGKEVEHPGIGSRRESVPGMEVYAVALLRRPLAISIQGCAGVARVVIRVAA